MADTVTEQVRKNIQRTAWAKQDAKEAFKEAFEALIESQDKVKDSTDKYQDALIKQLQANQQALNTGLTNIGDRLVISPRRRHFTQDPDPQLNTRRHSAQVPNPQQELLVFSG